ncbi:MAG: jacalin-like lectin domain protein [Chloroflexi bacterium]|nr:jacalin-like lectin domain protein [Chloroflexota bacterium]
MSTLIKCGPSGGISGSDFDDTLLAAGKRIVKVTIGHGTWVDAVQVSWSDGSSSLKHSGDGGSTDTISFAADEYLTGITGKYGAKVDSIRFITNKTTYGPDGGPGGDVEYHYNAGPAAPELRIAGFLGRCGRYVDAIGCVFAIGG